MHFSFLFRKKNISLKYKYVAHQSHGTELIFLFVFIFNFQLNEIFKIFMILEYNIRTSKIVTILKYLLFR